MKNFPSPNAQAMVLSTSELETLQKANDILLDVMLAYGGENTIMSLETGEVITPGELSRVRGILEFLATYRMIEVNP